MKRDLSTFKSNLSLSEKVLAAIWRLQEAVLFRPFLTPSRVRVLLLKIFGAKVHSSVIIKSGVKVLFPWKLTIGEGSWIGEGAWFINHEEIVIGDNVCISQGVTLCSSGHDFKTPNLLYKHSAITISDGAWICLKAIILPGSQVGTNSVISSGEVFTGRIEKDIIFRGGNSKAIEYEIES